MFVANKFAQYPEGFLEAQAKKEEEKKKQKEKDQDKETGKGKGKGKGKRKRDEGWFIYISINHRLPKLKSRLFDVFLRALRAADSTYVVYATACVYREMYGKITGSLKSDK